MSIYKKKTSKTKIFIGLTLSIVTLSALVGKTYLWAYDTTLAEQKDLALSKISQAIDEKTQEINQAAKNKTKNFFSLMLEKIGIEQNVEKEDKKEDKVYNTSNSSYNKLNSYEQNIKNIKNVSHNEGDLKTIPVPSSFPKSLPNLPNLPTSLPSYK